MKIKFGAIVVDGRGKVGGHVASKNRGGAYLRTKVTPSNPQTIYQTQVRSAFTNFSQGWKSLTQAQRDAWNEAVDNFTSTDIFGDIKKPSGINLYIKLNGVLQAIGAPTLVNPPLPQEVPAATSVSATASAGGGTLNITFTPDPVPADTVFLVECTAQVSVGRNFLKNEFRTLTGFPPATVSPQDVGADYIARFGNFTEGLKIGVRITPVNINTGQKGLGLSTTLIVAA